MCTAPSPWIYSYPPSSPLMWISIPTTIWSPLELRRTQYGHITAIMTPFGPFWTPSGTPSGAHPGPRQQLPRPHGYPAILHQHTTMSCSFLSIKEPVPDPMTCRYSPMTSRMTCNMTWNATLHSHHDPAPLYELLVHHGYTAILLVEHPAATPMRTSIRTPIPSIMTLPRTQSRSYWDIPTPV